MVEAGCLQLLHQLLFLLPPPLPLLLQLHHLLPLVFLLQRPLVRRVLPCLLAVAVLHPEGALSHGRTALLLRERLPQLLLRHALL